MSEPYKMKPSLFFPNVMIPDKESIWDKADATQASDSLGELPKVPNLRKELPGPVRQSTPIEAESENERKMPMAKLISLLPQIDNLPRRPSLPSGKEIQIKTNMIPSDSIEAPNFSRIIKRLRDNPGASSRIDSLVNINKNKNRPEVESGTVFREKFPTDKDWRDYENSTGLQTDNLTHGTKSVMEDGVQRTSVNLRFMDYSGDNTRVTGYAHNHLTPGTAPSPADMKILSEIKKNPNVLEKRASNTLGLTITPDHVYGVTVENPKKLKSITPEMEEKMETDFLNLSHKMPQEAAFIETFIKEPSIRGTFGIHRSPMGDPKPGSTFERAVVTRDGKTHWVPIKEK